MTTLRDQICTATDELDALRRSYFQQQGVTYEDMSAAATKVLELRQEAEKARGKVKTQVNSRSIASLIRGSF
jgi:hypothetical protein